MHHLDQSLETMGLNLLPQLPHALPMELKTPHMALPQRLRSLSLSALRLLEHIALRAGSLTSIRIPRIHGPDARMREAAAASPGFNQHAPRAHAQLVQDERRVGGIHDLCSVGQARGPQLGGGREDVQEAGGVVVFIYGLCGVGVDAALALAVGVAEVCGAHLRAVGLAED